MEVNLPSASYILPESTDLALLSARSTQADTNTTAPIPIWTAITPTDKYYDFEVYAESVGDMEMECNENQTKLLCQICKIEIPTAYLKEHIGSDMHKTFLKILENAIDRLKMHATNEIQRITEISHSDSYFCPYCCDAVKMVDKDVHVVSKKHEIACKYYETIKSLQNSYEDKENFTKNINFLFDNEDDSTSLSLDENTRKKKKRNGKNKSVAHDTEEINDNLNKIFTKSDESVKTSIVEPKLDINIEKKSTVTVHEANTLKSDVITSNTGNVAIEPSSDQNKLMVALNVTNTNKDVDEPMFDRKIGTETYLQGIKLENASLAIGVTITFNEGCKVSVSMDNFHGLYREAGHVQCRLCRVLVLDEEQHVTGGIHMQYAQSDIPDQHCIRQLDQIWSHCIICNEHVERKDVHILTAKHMSRLNKAIIIKNTNNTIRKSERSSQTTLNYCNVCNIVMPLTKEARKKHRSSKDHKDKALSFSEANKQDSIALQATAAPATKVVVNSANKVQESQNRDALTKFCASVKPSASKHVMTADNDDHNAIKVQHQCNLRAAKAEQISTKPNSKEFLINSKKINLETLLATPSSSKQEFNQLNVNHTPRITKAVPEIKTNNVKNIPVTTIDEVFCHACQTKVPNSNASINDHLSGKRHTSNLAQMLSANRIVIQNGEYFCGACTTGVLNVNVLKHLQTGRHLNAIFTRGSKRDVPNPVKNSQELKSHQICVETKSPNTDIINGASAENTLGNHIIPKWFEATNNPKELFCLYCEAFVPYTDSKEHVENPKHRNRVNNPIYTLKVKYQCLYVFLQETTDLSKVLCVLCNENFENSPKFIHEHCRHDSKHHHRYRKLIELNKILYIQDSTTMKYICKVCKVHLNGAILVDHVNSATHERNLKPLPEGYMKYYMKYVLDSVQSEDVAISQKDLVNAENQA